MTTCGTPGSHWGFRDSSVEAPRRGSGRPQSGPHAALGGVGLLCPGSGAALWGGCPLTCSFPIHCPAPHRVLTLSFSRSLTQPSVHPSDRPSFHLPPEGGLGGCWVWASEVGASCRLLCQGLVYFLGVGVGGRRVGGPDGTPAPRTLDPELRWLPVGSEMLTWPSLRLAWALEFPPRSPSLIWKAERGAGKLRVVPSALPPTRHCSLGPGSGPLAGQPLLENPAFLASSPEALGCGGVGWRAVPLAREMRQH